jgi:hypothetical protein
MIQVTFKICYSAQKARYEVPGHWTTEYFFHKIRDNLSVDLDIPNTYHIVPGPGLQAPQYRGLAEEHPPVEMRNNRALCEYCNPNEINVFYVRFFDEPALLPDPNEIQFIDSAAITQ